MKLFLCLPLLWCMLLPEADAKPPSPPGQPAAGPGGMDGYVVADITEAVYYEGLQQFILFEPSPRPALAPVIVFLHAWGVVSPGPYYAWIRHMVRRGSIVIYPRYQVNVRTPIHVMTPAAVQAVRTALELCDGDRHTKADTSRFALAGHSLGGIIAANIADGAARERLPVPSALMIVHPADSASSHAIGFRVPSMLQQDYDGIADPMLMLIVVGEEDRYVQQGAACTLYMAARRVSEERRELIMLRSDRHGMPPLVADHLAPLSPRERTFSGYLRNKRFRGEVDALDYYGYWKLLDAVCLAAFYGEQIGYDYAFGGTAEQTYMGTWSDGTAVVPLIVNPQ